MREDLGEERQVIGLDPPGEGLPQRRQLGAQLAARQLGQHRGVLLAAEQCVQHVAPALAQDIGRHRAELDIRPLQQRVEAVGLLRALLHQRLTVARQLAQPADRGGRDEAGGEQAVAQQVGQPLAVSG